MNTLEATAKALADTHEWLTEENATKLLVHAYMTFRDEARYGGNKVAIHMQISYGVMLRSAEEDLRNRLALAQEWVG